jgi:hypothetical protein
VSSARRAAVLPLALAVGGVLLASAPAFATVKATWNTPVDNSTYTTTSPIDFSVTLDRGSSVLADSASVTLSLSVPGPTPGPFKVDTSASSSDRDLKFTFTPSCPNYAASCSGSAPSYNGRYTATLGGAVTGSRTINLELPPATPTGVTAAAAGTHRVRVAWAANTEPDLTGYDVFADDGTSIAANLPASQTSFEFDLPSSGYGGTHGYVVRAHRLACANCPAPGDTAQLDSPMSQTATVTFTEPGATQAPLPRSDGGGGTTSGGGDGGGYNDGGNGKGNNGNGNGNGGDAQSTSGSSTGGYNSGSTGGSYSSGSGGGTTKSAQDRSAFSLLFKSFSPKLGAPKLPPLPKFANPGEAPLPEGTYDPMLDYGTQTLTERQRIASGGGITDQFVDTVASAFEGRRLYRSIAISMLLLLAAAHLRLWLRHPDAQ